MCAMKEVTLFSDDAKSKESAKQLGQVSCFHSAELQRFHFTKGWSLLLVYTFSIGCSVKRESLLLLLILVFFIVLAGNYSA